MVEGVWVCSVDTSPVRLLILLLRDMQLFDALFQIHALKLSHRGRDATKNLADERYANVPDATVRAFLDSCPVCSARRGGQGHVHHVVGDGTSAVALHHAHRY